MAQPYQTIQQGRYWYCVDTRTGAKVSYPETTRWQSDQNTATLNAAYREAVAATGE